jgi:hypothetical protein
MYIHYPFINYYFQFLIKFAIRDFLLFFLHILVNKNQKYENCFNHLNFLKFYDYFKELFLLFKQIILNFDNSI